MRRIKYLIWVLTLSLFLVGCDELVEQTSAGDLAAQTYESESVSESETVSEHDSAFSEATDEQPDVSEEAKEAESEGESVQENSQPEASEEKASEEGIEAGSEEESVSEEPAFTVENYSAVLFVKKAVNVRMGPSTDYEKIGALGKGEQIQVTGIADTGWYQIDYNGTAAYVSANYLIDEASYQAMIAQEEAEALAAQQASEEAARLAAEQAAQQQAQAEAAGQQEQQQQQSVVNTDDYRTQVVAIMNQERAAAGIGGISQNASLDAVAQIRAQEIAQSFSHTRPNGTSCFTVLDENGVAYMSAGENIAAGYGTPADVMTGWMNSEGHRANILNGSFGQVGIGYYADPNSGYGTYWVQIFTN